MDLQPINVRDQLTLASLRGKTPHLGLRGGGVPLGSLIAEFTMTAMLFFLYSTSQMRKIAAKIRVLTYILFA